ncbi:hypothetical protein BGZ60DRAFT_407630 [Tricladium varicosporioides]|nr:hypothetical protein BGZ60DRAFT_407630 [Hymenoscyphus varicosporioides]
MGEETRWHVFRSLMFTCTGLSRKPRPLPHSANLSPTTFHPFSRLPIELQIQIWEFALASLPSRVLEIHEHEGLPTRCFAPPPSLLHTCYQSRLLALKSYTLSFITSQGRGFHVDHEKDIVYFGPNSCFRDLVHNLIDEPDLQKTFKLFGRDLDEYQKFKRVALSAYLIYQRPRYLVSHALNVGLHLGLFPSLSELVLLGRQTGQKVIVPGRTPTIWMSDIVDFDWQYGFDPGIGRFKQGFWSSVNHHREIIIEWNRWRDYIGDEGKRVDIRVGGFVKGKGDSIVRRETWGGYLMGHMPAWAV